MHLVLVFGSIVIASAQLLGNWLLRMKRSTGWMFTFIMYVTGVPYDLYTEQYGFVGATVINVFISVAAWREWKKDEAGVLRLETFMERKRVSREMDGTWVA